MLFAFEQGLIKSPHYIPMFVRMKFTLTSAFLAASQWAELTAQERSEVLTQPGVNPEDRDQFAARIRELSAAHPQQGGAQAQPKVTEGWSTPGPADPTVQAQLEVDKRPTLSAKQWDDLSALQRFTLMVLAREPSLREYLGTAIQEFHAGT